MRAVKFASSLLALVSVLTLCGCETPNTRRELFAPKQGSGYWTTTWKEGQTAAEGGRTRTPARDYTPPKKAEVKP